MYNFRLAYEHKTTTGYFPESLFQRVLRIKAGLLTGHVAISPETFDFLADSGFKMPRPVRSGMSSGLEFYVILPNGTRMAVSCLYRIAESWSDDYHIHGTYLHTPGGDKFPVEFLPTPAYYHFQTSSGLHMANVAQQSFSKLAIGVFGKCSINANPHHACRFCAIHSVGHTDAQIKKDRDILETVQAASDSELSTTIETIMLGGGTPSSPDRGALRYSNLAEQIRRVSSWEISVMMVPPASNAALRDMRNSGVSYLSINMEFGSQDAFQLYTPGKAELIGKQRYMDCLEAAVDIFGPGNVQSLLVTGLPGEPEQATLEAVEWLSSRGVLPVLSPYRPLPGTVIDDIPAPETGQTIELYLKAAKTAHKHGMYLGPKCVDCQGNTMSLPWDRPLACLSGRQESSHVQDS